MAVVQSFHLGATGRPTLTYLIKRAKYHGEHMVVDETPNESIRRASHEQIEIPVNELIPSLLRRVNPPPLENSWSFYHDRHSPAGADVPAYYEPSLSLILANIDTIKPFWELYNASPLSAVRPRDSVHFFKKGVRPVWEDAQNVRGGSLTFRVPHRSEHSSEFWKELLLLAVGEQFDLDAGKTYLFFSPMPSPDFSNFFCPIF